MAKDDFHIIVFKVLSYFYQSIKEGVKPTYEGASAFAKCNEIYFDAVLKSLIDDKYIACMQVGFAEKAKYLDLRITSAGVQYLEENSKMGQIKQFLGVAFEKSLSSYIAVMSTIN